MLTEGADIKNASYTYDKNNRLLEEAFVDETTQTSAPIVNTTQNGNRRTTVKTVTTTTTLVEDITFYTYDPNGNLLTVTDGEGTATYTYNARNQQVGYTAGLTSASYTYNPDGLRRTKTTTGMPDTQYVWSGGMMVYECELLNPAAGTVHVYGVNLLSSRTTSGSKRYYLYNAHGDVVQLLNSSKTLVKNYKYDAFGVEYNIDPNDPNPFRYCGEYFDKETGTYYLRARYYDPANGRFTQEDTHWTTKNSIYGDNPNKLNESKSNDDKLGLNTYTHVPDIYAITQSSNLYVYCGNNPIIFVDPNGEIFMLLSAAVGAVAGAIVGGVVAASTGKNVWAGIGIGAAAGGVIGLGAGAAAGLLLASSATATTLAVVTGFKSLALAMTTGGLAAGAAYLLENIKNAFAEYTVLGSYPGYLELAKQLNARVFSIATEVWDKLTNAQQWALNLEFLDKSIQMGHEFILSVNAYSARVGSYLYDEIQYLLSQGYRIVDEGWRLIK